MLALRTNEPKKSCNVLTHNSSVQVAAPLFNVVVMQAGDARVASMGPLQVLMLDGTMLKRGREGLRSSSRKQCRNVFCRQ